MCYISYIRKSLFAESRVRSIISSTILKSDVSERNGSRLSVLVIQKQLQLLDSRMRTALACCSARVHHQFSLHSSSRSLSNNSGILVYFETEGELGMLKK